MLWLIRRNYVAPTVVTCDKSWNGNYKDDNNNPNLILARIMAVTFFVVVAHSSRIVFLGVLSTPTVFATFLSPIVQVVDRLKPYVTDLKRLETIGEKLDR